MIKFQLAQLNIAKMKYPIDSPELADFVGNLDNINALADDSPGFIWRLQTDAGDATGIDFFGDDTLVNMSIWKDVESLHSYVYRSAHNKIMSRRKEWFHRVDKAYTVLWWIVAGTIPLLEEAKDKLELLKSQGPTAEAFSIKHAFPAPTIE
ncbi:MAG: DUF3291 domain-containing protein [Gammaproteobacteria bacterium]